VVFDVLYTIMTRDMALAHAGDYDRSSDAMSAHLRALIEHGLTVKAADCDAAVQQAESWRRDFEGCSAIIQSFSPPPPTTSRRRCAREPARTGHRHSGRSSDCLWSRSLVQSTRVYRLVSRSRQDRAAKIA
jgi:hypothetical protein